MPSILENIGIGFFNNSQKKSNPWEHVTQVVSSTPISDMILTGIYKLQGGGYIIVSLKKERDSSIISIGEVSNGYKLIEIETKRAIFEKNSKRYVVNMLDSDVKLPNVTTAKLNNDGSKKSSAAASKRVSKKDIAYYAKNFNDIWKDIGIKETKENGKITGFEVTKIRDKSSFAELGLLKGDVIIKANNVELHSYADALSIYKNINKLDALELVVLRDNQEVEIIYEVN